MKKYIIIILVLLFICQLSAQSANNMGRARFQSSEKFEYVPYKTDEFKFTTKKPGLYTKEEWRALIDTTWGEGRPTEEKLQIFDICMDAIDKEFACFINSNIDWDYLMSYRDTISSGVSRGRFAGILSYIFFELLEVHTISADLDVFKTPVNPGIPMLVLGYYGYFLEHGHFGAGLTPLPDSSLVVYTAVSDHPLGLQPGDIVLGYDGLPWSKLYKQLIKAQLPITTGNIMNNRADLYSGSTISSRDHIWLSSAGLNWHLFDTIDIIKYGTQDTLHLATSALMDKVMQITCTEQIAIPGVNFPDVNGDWITHGIIDNTNIGYIYAWDFYDGSNLIATTLFHNAVKYLMVDHPTEGMIIDLRTNHGGQAAAKKGFALLFNENLRVLDFGARSDPSEHLAMKSPIMSSFLSADNWEVIADKGSIYDRPIAVLTGPVTISAGDIHAFQLKYHPMTRFFGKETNTGYGGNDGLNYPWKIDLPFNEWCAFIARVNLCLVEDRDVYFTHVGFDIDEEIWLNPEDISRGKDTVVEKALEWINNLTYAYDIALEKSYIRPSLDSALIRASVQNPNEHDVNLIAYIKLDSDSLLDSLYLSPDPTTGLWQATFHTDDENTFHFSVKTEDKQANTQRLLSNVAHFTTVGPVALNHYRVVPTSTNPDTIPGAGDQLRFEFTLRNDGQIATAKNVTAKLKCLSGIDTAEVKGTITFTYQDIEAGQMKTATQKQYIKFADSLIQMGQVDIPFRLEIYSSGILYWSSDFTITDLGIEKAIRPEEFALYQNYPNPFNPVTTISYTVGVHHYVPVHVELNIYNILGQKVATLVSEKQPAGKYEVQWDASGFSSGVYFYQLSTDQGFVQTRKLVLLR